MSPPPPEPKEVNDQEAALPRIRRWNAPECAFGIDYSTEVINAIRKRAVDGFYALPHGGLEVGGLLFGRVYPNARAPLRIEITAERPIECAHHHGPGFLLTEEERAQIGIQLERTRLEPEIAAFSVVGFWVSHSRGELALADQDVEIYKLFPNLWQFILVLKPEAGVPTRATFIFRTGSGIYPHRPEHEFYTDAVPTVQAAQDTLPQTEKYRPVERRATVRSESHPVPDNRRVSISLAAFLITVSMLIGAGGTYGLIALGKRAAAARTEPVNLEIFSSATGALVHWNAFASEIQNANRGDLLIREGYDKKNYVLTSALLKRGFITYNSRTRDISATLTVIAQNGRVQVVTSKLIP